MHFKRWKQFNEAVAAATPDIKNKINVWNTKYAQQFKFENNRPDEADVSVIKDISGLKKVIKDSYFNEVNEGISEFVKLCKEKVFHDFIKTNKLTITGHTSTKASHKYNESLSNRRAKIIKNVIITALAKAGITDLDFTIVGKGETEPLIINDYKEGMTDDDEKKPWNDPIKFAKNFNISMPDNATPEQRMTINRRITILLPDMTEPKQEIKVDKINTVPVKTTEDKLNIRLNFYTNSALLKPDSQEALIDLCEKINKSTQDIKELYLWLTVLRGEELDNINVKQDENNRDSFLDILSVNRAFIVRKIIEGKLTKNSIKIHTYPASYMYNKDSCVVSTIKDDNVERAKEKLKEIAKKHSSILVDANGSLDNAQTIIDNIYLDNLIKINILHNIKEDSFSKSPQCYPLELYYDKKGGIFGLDYFKGLRDKYKKTYENLILKYNKQFNRDFVLSDFITTDAN